MASYAPLPAYQNPANAMVNFQPINDALGDYNKGMTVAGESTAKINAANAMAAGDYTKAAGELAKVDPRAAMEMKMQPGKEEAQQNELRMQTAKMLGGHAQTILDMYGKDPEGADVAARKWLSSDPKFATGLAKMGVADWQSNPRQAVQAIHAEALGAHGPVMVPEGGSLALPELSPVGANPSTPGAASQGGARVLYSGGPKQPEWVKDYEYYANQEKAAGRVPKTADTWDLERRRAGAIGIVNSGETTQSQELGKDRAKREIGIRDAGEKAYDELSSVNIMRQAMRDPKFYSGVGAQAFALPLKQAITAFGGDPNATVSMEVFRSQANKSVMQDIGGSLGVGISNADRSFIERQVATLDNSPAGNSALLDIKEKLARRKIEVARLQEDYIAEHGKVDQQFQTDLRRWRDSHPMFQESEAGASGPPRPGSQPPQPGRRSSIPDGQPGSRSSPAYAPTLDAARSLPSGVWFTVPGETEPRLRN